MIVKRGKELEKYIAEKTKGVLHDRDFTERASWYADSSVDKVFAVSGLRGTGKTVGLLSVLRGRDAVYFCAGEFETAGADEWRRMLGECQERVICIDEYSWIPDRGKLDSFLYQLVQDEKRVLITGTESFTINMLNYGGLIHRVLTEHVTWFSYPEYCRVFGLSGGKEDFFGYLEKGGVFPEYITNNFDAMKAYLESAIIKPLGRYLKMAGGTNPEAGAAAVYAILHDAVCRPSGTVPLLSKSAVLSRDRFLERMGAGMEFTDFDFNRVSELLETTGFIVRLKNLAVPGEYRTYITNPALTAQIICAVYEQPPGNMARVRGRVFEAVTVSHAALALSDELKKGYIETHGADNLEIDFYAADKYCVYLFECKSKEKPSLDVGASIRKDIPFFPDAEEIHRFVIYNGNACIREMDGKEIKFLPAQRMDLLFHGDLENMIELEEGTENGSTKAEDGNENDSR